MRSLARSGRVPRSDRDSNVQRDGDFWVALGSHPHCGVNLRMTCLKYGSNKLLAATEKMITLNHDASGEDEQKRGESIIHG